jgi:thioredoxin 1
MSSQAQKERMEDSEAAENKILANFINDNLPIIKMTTNDKVPELTNGEFEAFTKEGTVLIDFFADWCMPCMMMSPIVDELSEKMGDKVKFGKVNVDDNRIIAQKFNVSSIPHFVILKDGEVKEVFNGSLSEEDLEEKVKAHL